MEFFDTDFLRDEEIVLRLKHTAEGKPEQRRLPAYYFNICSQDGTVMGNCDLRIGYNDRVYYGGNIGYGIFPDFRGHHYAAKACRLLFELAKRHGMEYLYITCRPENVASAKTCELAGGRLMELAELPPDSDLREDGYTAVRIYKIDL